MVVFRPGQRVKYEPDWTSFGEFILSDQMRDVTADVAAAIGKLAGEYAPRRKSGVVPDGAAMADRFKVNKVAGTIVVDGAPRVMVHVFNDAPSAAPNEFGSKNKDTDGEDNEGGAVRNGRHRMLGRAGAAFGDFKGVI